MTYDIEQIRIALQLASAYIMYVKDANVELHLEANGTPSTEVAVNDALQEIHKCTNCGSLSDPYFDRTIDFFDEMCYRCRDCGHVRV